MFNDNPLSASLSLILTSCSFSLPLSELSLLRRSRREPDDSLAESMGGGFLGGKGCSLALDARERVLTEERDAVVVAAAEAEEEEERRARLLERVVGPEEGDEGAAEEASARFRLRVSIQNPTNPQSINSLATERQSRFHHPYHGSNLCWWNESAPQFETLEIADKEIAQFSNKALSEISEECNQRTQRDSEVIRKTVVAGKP